MSNDYPLVSIIIPTYNSSDYITETLTKLENKLTQILKLLLLMMVLKITHQNVLREYGLTHSQLIIINKKMAVFRLPGIQVSARRKDSLYVLWMMMMR